MFRARLVPGVLTNPRQSVSLMGTAHGAEELGRCSKGHACQSQAEATAVKFSTWHHAYTDTATEPAAKS